MPWPFGSLRKVDDVDLQENEGVVELAKEADEEARRLLYVGLTRARDLLIPALPEKTPDGGLLESLGPDAARLLKPALQGTTFARNAPDNLPTLCELKHVRFSFLASIRQAKNGSPLRSGCFLCIHRMTANSNRFITAGVSSALDLAVPRPRSQAAIYVAIPPSASGGSRAPLQVFAERPVPTASCSPCRPHYSGSAAAGFPLRPLVSCRV